MSAFIVLLGIAFGYVLSRSGAGDYGFVQGMFLLTNFQLYGIIGTAVAVTAPGLWLLRLQGRALGGAPLAFEPKARNRGNEVGGFLFGVGWSITGMCPGPIFVNIGEGKVYALAALAGALAGTMLLAQWYPALAGRLQLLRDQSASRDRSMHSPPS